MNDICLVGGIDMNVVVQVPHLPRPGETVRGGEGSNRAGAQPSLPRRTEVEELLLRGERS
jgi:hypothetical protein